MTRVLGRSHARASRKGDEEGKKYFFVFLTKFQDAIAQRGGIRDREAMDGDRARRPRVLTLSLQRVRGADSARRFPSRHMYDLTLV